MEAACSNALQQRVLVIEDDPRMLDLVCHGLREVGHTAMPAADGDTGLQLALALNFDCVILDLGLPGRDGYSVADAIRAKKNMSILMLTARDREEDLLRGFEAGADDYLTKPFSFRELLARLDVLSRSSQMQQAPALTLDATRLTVQHADIVVQLTRSEYLLLAKMHKHRGTAIDRTSLIASVWGHNRAVSPNTLEVLVNALRAKLHVFEPVLCIETVRGTGYQLQLHPTGPS